MLSPVAASVCSARDGAEARWEGFFTGHRVWDGTRVAESAKRLLGMDTAAVARAAGEVVRPYRAQPGRTAPSLLLHTTTPLLKAFDGDLAALLSGQEPHDVTTYVEARSVYLGTPDDLTLGRTAPWAEAAALRGVPAVDIGDLDHYYLTHALLLMAEAHEERADTPLRHVIDWLRDRPDAVVRLYALDVETQIFLLWLLRRTGLAELATDANSPAVATEWNRKNHIHPTVAAARAMPAAALELPPEELLAAEQRLGRAHQRLGLTVPVLPGYTIARSGVDRDAFVAGVLDAAALLRTRYGLSRAALKPADAGDGARIVGNLDLADTGRLAAEARTAYAVGDDHLLEAWATFLTVSLGGEEDAPGSPAAGPPGPGSPTARRVPVVPSGHIRNGQVAEGLTLQMLDGYSWRGNDYVDEAGWAALGLPRDAYRTVRAALEAVRAAFQGPESIADGSHGGLVTGGIDFAVGRLGGAFGDRLLVGAIDFNLSAHGAESLRTFRDRAREQGIDEPYAATRVFLPPADRTLHQLAATARSMAVPGALLEAVACVPRRWGMVAATGAGPAVAAARAEALVAALTTPGPRP
ncbi:hypothetical protein N7925_14335 [Streptomyces sp. CA-278952]|uniref:hypothetical protein n=1 Tax=Streptomyces sp. CA-278952 TaxID=2980556 RepID=UPI0023680A32|nr:hypothetical protein [Streptomyces sp. CA-278952]WDG29447.1 hypothetical protein N7925_14335 [Streptomyces sp. CA-278952]